jgi:hypothetical protein
VWSLENGDPGGRHGHEVYVVGERGRRLGRGTSGRGAVKLGRHPVKIMLRHRGQDGTKEVGDNSTRKELEQLVRREYEFQETQLIEVRRGTESRRGASRGAVVGEQGGARRRHDSTNRTATTHVSDDEAPLLAAEGHPGIESLGGSAPEEMPCTRVERTRGTTHPNRDPRREGRSADEVCDQGEGFRQERPSPGMVGLCWALPSIGLQPCIDGKSCDCQMR